MATAKGVPTRAVFRIRTRCAAIEAGKVSPLLPEVEVAECGLAIGRRYSFIKQII